MKFYLKSFLVLILFLSAFKHSSAQSNVKTALLGVNGLTCSACTRTVEMQLRKLNFIKDVEMNLEHTNGKITFKENAEIDPSKIAKAVTDAGFSVRFLELIIDFKSVNINNDYCYKSGSTTFQFFNTGTKNLTGETTVKLVGELFQPKSDYKKIKDNLKVICDVKTPVYFVTL